MKTKTKLFTLAVGVAFIYLGAHSVLGATTIEVSPCNPGCWAFYTDSPNGVGEFVNGPFPPPDFNSPPLGNGSANLITGDGTVGGDGSAQIRNACYAGTTLRTLTALSYCTLMASNNGQQFPYIQLDIDLNGDGLRDDILFFEPPYQTPTSGNPSLPDQGATALFTWQCWDARIGGWWANSELGGATPGTGVKSMDDYIAAAELAYPGNTPTIVNRTDGIGGVRLTVGYAEPDVRFNGNVDAVTIGVSGVNTTYDFELECVAVDSDGDGVPDHLDNCPATPNAGQADTDFDGVGDVCDNPTNQDQCKNGGWQTLFRADGTPFQNQGDCIQYVNTGN